MKFLLLAAAAAARERTATQKAFALSDEYLAQRAKRTPPPPLGANFSGIFGSGMVLQQNAKAAIFGTADEGATVTIELGGDASETKTAEVGTLGGDANAWRVDLSERSAGGNYTLTLTCDGCANATTTTLVDITFGDVYLCAGQSNAWLVMNFALGRNESYARVREGRYDHVRMRTQSMLNISDADASYLAPPPPEYNPVGGFPDGGWVRATGGVEDVNNTVAQFSAMCWFFAESMSDYERSVSNKKEPTPIGLVGAYWGGTIAEMWIPNSTLYDEKKGCKNVTGGPPYQRDDYANGAVYNGMVRPWANSSFAAVLWYQGENNLEQCVDDAPDGGENTVAACGSLEDRTGYACLVSTLVESWRDVLGDADLPFGVVQLASGTNEGFPQSMAAFRHAQTAGCGRLPCDAMPRVFAAQGHDVGDPWADDNARCNEPYAPYACQVGDDNTPNETPYTKFFMGNIHARTKNWVGRRLATAYRAMAGASDEAGAGPILTACDGDDASLTLRFDADAMGSDSVRVWHSPLAGGAPTAALEVRYGDAWTPAALVAQDSGATATVTLDGENATGVRYAWADAPFCNTDISLAPCAPNGGPLALAKGRLPALPFWADLEDGKCVRVSTAGG